MALVAEYHGNVAGYINVYANGESSAFANQGYPEIVDFGVLEKYRNNGIGNKLMDIAEQIAPDYSDTIFSPQGAGLQLYL
ncbi:MAG: GNAT family N-acetyltransferase [Lachnospiraceae bacterium]|nr:GNAT family N-acetyltransferase [Lachnospiraceae bacterium]